MPSVDETRPQGEPTALNAADLSSPSHQRELRHDDELPSQRRRVRVQHERSRAVVLRAIPKGHKLARHVVAWKRAALEHPALEQMRADGRANMLRLIEIIGQQQDAASRTWRTTWAWVGERLGVHEDSVGRMIRRLKDWGLLAVVATGRSASHTPRSTGKKQGEAPVYALTVQASPSPAEQTPKTASEPVEISVGPVPPEGVDLPPHAREDDSTKDAATPRPSAKRAAQRREVVAALRRRTAPLWPAHATVRPRTTGGTRRDWKQAYRLAALELQYRALVLRSITTAHVTSVARPFFAAGWSLHDVFHALHWTPEGQRYGHDAGTGIENAGAWLAARLRAWTRPDGTPVRSVDQRAAAEVEQRRAEALAAAQRRAAAQAPVVQDPRPFRVRYAAQIAAAEAVAERRAAAERTCAVVQDRRPFRERYAAQIAAGTAQVVA